MRDYYILVNSNNSRLWEKSAKIATFPSECLTIVYYKMNTNSVFSFQHGVLTFIEALEFVINEIHKKCVPAEILFTEKPNWNVIDILTKNKIDFRII